MWVRSLKAAGSSKSLPIWMNFEQRFITGGICNKHYLSEDLKGLTTQGKSLLLIPFCMKTSIEIYKFFSQDRIELKKWKQKTWLSGESEKDDIHKNTSRRQVVGSKPGACNSKSQRAGSLKTVKRQKPKSRVFEYPSTIFLVFRLQSQFTKGNEHFC